ncbi:hypothetical protein PRECH8_02830 [Insulibacter thermoxylanivorax]|uniref:Major membrane immunogen, membrane-anchored lipoprotein n=1 Tax=Insulibacter thermoxylanivorax TaxID=2749268 RepID=A0A916QEN3_9BACL|nr:FMN-binding protein [Insulibacter thermoxylanivorax]GFR36987.1 hypothetical protein PRECH8_02830 [Insulibacter thermoxylanivorax]
MGKKLSVLLLALMLVVGVLAGCGGNNANNADNANAANEAANTPAAETENEGSNEAANAGQWEDGVYYAEGEFREDNAWKEVVALTVEGGKITSVNWNALNKEGGLDKKEAARQGKYGMIKAGAIAEWHEQAEKAEQFLIETQDLDAFALNEDGKTDAVSGVTINLKGFVDVVKKALAAGPVEPGPYKDGTYYAEEPDFGSSGWKYTATITVMAGNIVAADWNGIHKDGGDDKDTVSKNGEYGMVEKGGAQAEWHEQAYLAEQYLIETQDPTAITYTTEQGHTDAISGVTIHVVEFFTLAEEALANAK